MIAIVKVKIKYDRVQNPSIVWVYNSIEEAAHKGSQLSEGNLLRTGYKLMRRGKELDQYAINFTFKGDKDKTFTMLEKELKPLFRDRVLNDLLEN